MYEKKKNISTKSMHKIINSAANKKKNTEICFYFPFAGLMLTYLHVSYAHKALEKKRENNQQLTTIKYISLRINHKHAAETHPGSFTNSFHFLFIHNFLLVCNICVEKCCAK